jgi:isocitrate/isopropylmalate dehydrogenase
MAKHKIGWLPGDGVGRDVMEAARIVLDKLGFDAEYYHGDIGWNFWCKEGNALPPRTVQMLKQTDACLFGAITSKPKEEAEKDLLPELQRKGLIYQSPILQLRQEFNLHTNIRPCKAYPGNPLNYRDDINLLVFRESTECLYVGIEFHPVPPPVLQALMEYHPRARRYAGIDPNDIAISTRVMTRQRCEGISRRAFECARRHGYRSVTAVEKPNVTRETSGMLFREARKIAKQFSEIDFYEANIDAMCMWLLKNPQHYGVLLTSNLFGDILSKLCAQLVGGLGFGCSANIGDDYALFEPIHGSAPKYAGKYRVNPIGIIFAARMMLEHLEENEMANALESAIAKVIRDGKVRTYDMGGAASTLDMAKAIAERI